MPRAEQSLVTHALQGDAEDILRAAVDSVQQRTHVDRTFAALASRSGTYSMAIRHWLVDSRFEHLVVRSGRGLGGQVVAERRAVVTSDYEDDDRITGDYRPVVRAEGLRAIACVPVFGPGGVAALLYAGGARAGELGDRVLDELHRVCDVATVGLNLVAQREAARQRCRSIAAIAGDVVRSDDPGDLKDALARIVDRCETAVEPTSDVRLTPRERDVLDLLNEGASNRDIARRLVISEPTAKGHVRALLHKLEAASRLQIVANARRQGLI